MNFDITNYVSILEIQTDPTPNVQQLQEEIVKLRADLLIAKNTSIQQQSSNTRSPSEAMSFASIKDNSSLVNFYTGIQNASIFLWLLSLFKDEIKYTCWQLNVEDHLLLILMKLKLGLFDRDLAFRFKITQQVVSRIFRRWVPTIAKHTKFLIVWPERTAVKKNLPLCFKRKFKNCTCIIDCTEIFIERPLNLNARAQTWSNYKHSNTIKYLIGITPAGAVSFLSPGWGGKTSDKEITNKSGFLDKLEWGDCVMADRGFTIETELATRGVHLKIPKFTKGKNRWLLKMWNSPDKFRMFAFMLSVSLAD